MDTYLTEIPKYYTDVVWKFQRTIKGLKFLLNKTAQKAK